MASKHFGSVDATHVHIDCWLTINPGSGPHYSRRPGVKVSAGEPFLGRNERAINLTMKLPRALFETPSISASIEIEEPAQAVHIDAQAVADAVRQAIGMDVDIAVQMPEPSE